MRYTMTNVSLHGVKTFGGNLLQWDVGSGNLTTNESKPNFPVDFFSMDYTTMQWEYTKQDDTGAAKGTVATKINLSKGAGAS
jgi:type VI protein secretion system component Hcp